MAKEIKIDACELWMYAMLLPGRGAAGAGT